MMLYGVMNIALSIYLSIYIVSLSIYLSPIYIFELEMKRERVSSIVACCVCLFDEVDASSLLRKEG